MSHNTAECFFEKDKSRPINKDEKREKAMVMQEPREKIKELIFAGEVECKAVEVLIDSGASKNFISSDLENELRPIRFEN